MLRILGFDPSLTASGLACHCGIETIVPKGHGGPARLDYIAQAVNKHLPHVDLAIIEGYAYSARNNREVLGELGGVIRWNLWRREVPFATVPPTVLKKFATGRGNASKETVLIAAVKAGMQVANNNEADACFLRLMGVAKYGDGLNGKRLTTPQADAITTVAWPALITKGADS